MDRESPELIEDAMHQTRQALTDKVAALESQVTEKLDQANTTVHDTVRTVKDAVADTVSCVSDKVNESLTNVQDTVSNVKATLDVRDHIRERPWAVLIGATLSGAVAGYLLAPEHSQRSAAEQPKRPQPQPVAAAATVSSPRRQGLFDGLLDRLREEITTLGEAAIATLSASLKTSVNEGIKTIVTNTMTLANTQDRRDEDRQPCERHPTHVNGIAKQFSG